MPVPAARTAVQLAVHTPWSFHFGASPVAELASRAAECGITALAMTDTNGLWVAVPFQQACTAHGVRPLLGCRLRVEGEGAEARLRALDAAGYAAICRLSSRV